MLDFSKRSLLNSIHSPDPLSVRVKNRRPLWDAEDGVVVSSVLVVEVRGVEEVEALQGALHCQAEAGGPAPVTRESTLRRGRTRGVNDPAVLLLHLLTD